MIPELIGAAGSILGSIGGSILTGRSNAEATRQNIRIQKELAKNGLSWRVEDAKRAGINPLAALGASLPTGNPVAVGTDYGDLGLGQAGQNISRAMTSKMTKEQREIHELNKEMLQTQIEGQKLENRAKASQLSPPLPSAEYTSPTSMFNDPTVNIVPTQINASEQAGVESGAKPLFQKVIDKEGRATFTLQKDFGDIMESDTSSWMKYMYSQLKDFARSGAMAFSESARKKYEPYLRKIRPKHENPDYEYRYDPNNMNWVPHFVGNGGRSYIYHDTHRLKNQSEKRFKFNYKTRR